MDSVLRGAILYVVLLAIVRLSGRRTLAQMTPFDLVLVLIIAETTQQALLGDDFSITNAVVLIVTLIGMDILLSLLKQHSQAAGRVLDGVPTILVRRGEPDLRALRKARVDIAEVLEAAREKQGLSRLSQIGLAVLEPGGHITIVPQDKEREGP